MITRKRKAPAVATRFLSAFPLVAFHYAVISFGSFLPTAGSPFYLCFQQPQAFYISKFLLAMPQGQGQALRVLGKKSSSPFFGALRALCFGERIFFPKTLPLRPGQQVRCLIKSQRNYAGLT